MHAKVDLYYVYAHINENGEIVYIGKGKGGRAFAETNRKGSHKDFMLNYLSKGETHFVKFLELHLDEKDALSIEASLIREYQPAYNNFFTDAWKEDNKTRGLKGAEVTKKKCMTPMGEFDSLTSAAHANGFKHAGSIASKIKNKTKGYSYVEKETETDG